MAGRFGALTNGAVYMESDQCNCSGMAGYPHEPNCGLELIGFLARSAAAPSTPRYLDDPSLLPSMLWDFSGVDYSAGPHTTPVRVSAVGR